MKDFLLHFFLPVTTNNYRPKFLHHKILLLTISFLLMYGLTISLIRNNYPSVLGVSSDISLQQLLDLTNKQRIQNNLPPLTDSQALDIAAGNKATDMFSKDYWAHISPIGTTPWAFIKSAGYNYIYAGENLAKGFNSATDVINAWMASPDHRENMLSPNYKNVGFAVQTGRLNGEDTVLVVELLGSTTFAPEPIANIPSEPAKVEVAAGSPSVLRQTKEVAKVPEPTIVKSNPVSNTNLLAATSLSAKPLIDSATLSSFSAKAVLTFFILILVLDMIVIERRKIVRFVGHNLDHILFLSLILIILLFLTKGTMI